MNTVGIMGRLTADPDFKETANGVAVATFTLAVQRPKVKDKTDFIRCVAWRNTAEFINRYFSKGKMIGVTGVLTTRSWKDDQGGSHSLTEVLVDNVSFCGDKGKQEQAEQQPEPEPEPQQPEPMQTSVYDDDIPF